VDYLISHLSQHQLLTLFLGVFAEQAGVPVPALPLLLVAGMDAYGHNTYAILALLVVTAASSLADLLWFRAGRHYGRRALSLLCKFAISSDSCVRQSERSFARYGVTTLLIAKFIPGLTTLSRPMAGALGMSTQTFLIFNFAGTVLWAGSGIALGLIFHEQILRLLRQFEAMGGLALATAATLLAGYIALRLWRRLRLSRLKAKLPQVHPVELAQMLEREAEIVILDVQPAALWNYPANHIQGAIHVDLDSLHQGISLPGLSPNTHVVVYCSCPNDVSAVKAAHMLTHHGIKAEILTGGINAWTSLGLPMEQS